MPRYKIDYGRKIIEINAYMRFDMSTIYLIRHGESMANAGQVTYGSDTIHLTLLGEEQAAGVPSRLPDKIDHIIHSTYIRTKETAAPTIEAHPTAPVSEWASAREFSYLDPEKCMGTNLEDRKPMVEEFWNTNDAFLQVHPQSESFEQFIARVKETDRRLREDFGGARKTVALFTHALFMKAFFQVQEQPNTPVQKLMNEFFDCPVIHNCDIFTIEV